MGHTTANSVIAGPVLNEGEYSAVAAPAVEIKVKVPDNYEPGDKVPVQGPHGEDLEILLPPGAEAGKVMPLRMSPPADLRITVPPGLKAGQTMFFESAGTPPEKIAVKVPQGKGPGDTFDVTPPAVMVCVPQGAKPGDNVVFEINGKRCRTTVPDPANFSLGHFAARMPKPDDQVSLE